MSTRFQVRARLSCSLGERCCDLNKAVRIVWSSSCVLNSGLSVIRNTVICAEGGERKRARHSHRHGEERPLAVGWFRDSQDSSFWCTGGAPSKGIPTARFPPRTFSESFQSNNLSYFQVPFVRRFQKHT